MNYFFSPSTKGFYLKGLHSNIPNDAVGMTDDEYNAIQKKLQSGQVISVSNGKPTTIASETTMTWDQIVKMRDALLKDCDWTQLADSPLSNDKKTEWATYRQALRDITASTTDASKVVWPKAPS